MSERAVVLFGGSSSERKVSVASAQNIASTLPEVEPWFLAVDGGVHWVRTDRLLAHSNAFQNEFAPVVPARHLGLDEALAQRDFRDTVFVLALHGGDGENGATQRILETRGVSFTGSDSNASARAFDKVEAKRIVSGVGVRVAESVILPVDDAVALAESLKRFLENHGDVIAKPVADGSSIGLCRLRSEADVDPAVRTLMGLQVPYLLEPFLRGTELTVGVVETDRIPRALPVSEVRLEASVQFDYDAKYLGRGSREITPAEIPDTLAREVQSVAVKAHQALGCFGYSRTDFISTPNGLYFLETNTLPGLTCASFIPQQLAAAGVDFKRFLLDQIDMARKRMNNRPNH